MTRNLNRYAQIVETIFQNLFHPGSTGFEFGRAEIEVAAAKLKIVLPKKLGEIFHRFPYNVPLPDSILITAPKGQMWVIEPAGRDCYRFALSAVWFAIPNPYREIIKVPDATPGVVKKYRLSDEQDRLACLRYNRLVDLFTGLTCYSLQNHLRTSITGVGQVETDEIYLGSDRQGAHYLLPIQAKGGRDRLSVVQVGQDLALAATHFPRLICRALGAQFLDNGAIALFEFTRSETGIAIRQETHYRLMPPDELTAEDLAQYRIGFK